MNRTEHLLVILAEEGAEVATEACLLLDRLNSGSSRSAILLDLKAAFAPLVEEYADLLGTLSKLTGQRMSLTHIAARIECAEANIDGAGDKGVELDKMSRILAQISCEALTVGSRASKAVRFGLLEVQPGQNIPYSNDERLFAACANLIGIVEFAAKRYQINIDKDLQDRILAKGDKIEKFLAYSAQCGTLQNSRDD